MAFKTWFALFSLVGILVQTHVVRADGLDAPETSEISVRFGKEVPDLSIVSESPRSLEELVIEVPKEGPAKEPATPSPIERPSHRAPAATAPKRGEISCNKVCAEIRAFLRRDANNVKTEYERWMERLALKGDIVTYHGGESAAHGLLRFMANDYVTRAPENQMTMEFLDSLMNKCFPDAIVDIDRARMSELVNILWAAKNLMIEKKMNACN